MNAAIQAAAIIHKGQKIIAVKFDYDTALIKRFKALPGAKWSSSLKSWYLPDTIAYRKQFGIAEKSPAGKVVLQKIHAENSGAIAVMEEELILKNYSRSTSRTYLIEFAQLLYVLKSTPVNSLTYDELRKYFAWCLREQQISANQLHSRINAVKFYFETVLKQDKFFYEIPRPKKPFLLPKVISEDAIVRLLAAAENPKHKLLLSLCYGMGLRVSEICALKITDIDSDRMQVNIVAAKGKKDRYVNLPASMLS